MVRIKLTSVYETFRCDAVQTHYAANYLQRQANGGETGRCVAAAVHEGKKETKNKKETRAGRERQEENCVWRLEPGSR